MSGIELDVRRARPLVAGMICALSRYLSGEIDGGNGHETRQCFTRMKKWIVVGSCFRGERRPFHPGPATAEMRPFWKKMLGVGPVTRILSGVVSSVGRSTCDASICFCFSSSSAICTPSASARSFSSLAVAFLRASASRTSSIFLRRLLTCSRASSRFLIASRQVDVTCFHAGSSASCCARMRAIHTSSGGAILDTYRASSIVTRGADIILPEAMASA